jgi:hypothetical protein
MIVFEEKLRELIALLPQTADGFTVRYDWGTLDVLNKFLLLPESRAKYPLIWLVSGSDTDNFTNKTNTRRVSLVIATASNDVDQFNEMQYKTDYVNILLPIYEDLHTVLVKSGITILINDEITKELVPNFSFNRNEKGLIDIWNALFLNLEIVFDSKKCINKNIKF